MATDTAKVLETLGKMTVLELVELKNEDRGGVGRHRRRSDGGRGPRRCGGGRRRRRAAEEKTAFDVVSRPPATRRSR